MCHSGLLGEKTRLMDLGKAFGGKIRKFLFLVPEAGMALSAISTGAYQGTETACIHARNANWWAEG
jgi:uncharacterized membrane protein